jgi:NADH-quinone oxidoreductase subunit N
MFPKVDQAQVALDMLSFLPELVIATAIVLLLLTRLFRGYRRSHLGGLALFMTVLAFLLSVCQFPGTLTLLKDLFPGLKSPGASDSFPSMIVDIFEGLQSQHDKEIFGHLLVFDNLTIYLRCFLYSFTALVIWLSLTTGIPDREDSSDFYCLLLGATLGMAIMAQTAHLLMVFIGIEMASLPSYALAGYLKGRRQSSEAALKYVVYGGGAAGVMLFGISLLAGKFGTGYLPDVAVGVVHALHPPAGGSLDPVVLLGAFFLLVGIGFKVAVVPFHFWCPDVFEGASAEVAGYLSVASKGAALALLARVVLLLAGMDPMLIRATGDDVRWMDVGRILIPAIAFFAALTATFGNLAAYVQTNLKRLLAYSTIAHAGYMMMGLSTLTREGVQAVLFYLAAYLFMNLGAFAVVAYLRNQTGSEDLDSFRGLVRRSPWMVVMLAFFLLSLLGLPPLVGFAAKFQVFSALYHAGESFGRSGESGLAATLYGLLIIGGLNTVVSAMYYIKVLKVMILDRRAEDLEGREPVRLPEPLAARVFAGLMALLVLVLGILWGPMDRVSRSGADRFLAAVRNGDPMKAVQQLPIVAGGRGGGGGPPGAPARGGQPGGPPGPQGGGGGKQ